MYTYQELQGLGQKWLKHFAQVEFVGEIEISEDEISQLCPSVGQYLDRAGQNENIRAALVVAVVNLAFYSPQETGMESFRWLALQKLLGHYSEDDQRWQREVGEPTLRLLKEYFHAEDTGTAFRFVSPIMQQAGVPARLDRRFAQFLARLLQYYGHHFSDSEYNAGCIEFEGQMSTARRFLTSANGRQYCRDIIRIVRNVEEGLVTEQQVATLSFRFRNKVRQVLETLRSGPHTALRTTALPAPRLVLDRENLRLVVEFSEKGLDGAYQWIDGTKIRAARYILRADDFLGPLRFKSVWTQEQIEFPPVKPWRPIQNSWAAFRSTDGCFEIDGSLERESSILRSGRHLLAISGPHSIPEQHVIEELAELYDPSRWQLIIRVFDCELPDGFSLSDLNLAVLGGAPSRVPALRFSERQLPVPYTSNVFVGELPEIIIENRDANFADTYMLVCEEGSRRWVLPESLYRANSTFRLEANAPTQGQIHLEPKGRTPRGFVESVLRYVLLPDFKVTWPRGLYAEDTRVSVGLEPAAKIHVEWQQSSVVQAGESVWEMPSRLEFISGQVSFADSVSFFIAGPIERFSVKSETVVDHRLWNECLQQRNKIYISLSASERGGQIELGIADAEGFQKVIDLGPVPRNCQLIVSTDDVRDAFNERRSTAGRIAVRTWDSGVVRSDVIYLHEGLIAHRIFEDSDDEFKMWSQLLPDDLRLAVEGVRGMCSTPVSPFNVPDQSVPQSLQKFLSFYDICARVIDWHLMVDDSDERSDATLKETLDWYAEAYNFIDVGISSDPHVAKRLLERRPRKSTPFKKAQGTPTSRWRVKLADNLRRLKTLADMKRKVREDRCKVREWSAFCRAKRWTSAARCELVDAPGGNALTRAAEDYQYGLDVLAVGNREKANEYLSSAHESVRQAIEEAREGLVHEVALSLQVFIYYHYRHEHFGVKADEAIVFLGDNWGRFKKTLSLMGGVQGDKEDLGESLSLADFSPHRRDVEIEEQINQ